MYMYMYMAKKSSKEQTNKCISIDGVDSAKKKKKNQQQRKCAHDQPNIGYLVDCIYAIQSTRTPYRQS